MQKEKIKQAIEILKERDIDIWLTFASQYYAFPQEPACDLILGVPFAVTAAFLITKEGKTIAITASFEEGLIKQTKLYKKTVPYLQSIKEPLIKTLRELNPKKIAINYSQGDFWSDGLTHGMYLTLQDYLDGTEFTDRLVQSESIISTLRGKKSKSEIEKIKSAIVETEKMFQKVGRYMKPGKTEAQVADYMRGLVEKRGLTTAWDPDGCPGVFTGPDVKGPHGQPTKKKIKKGHVLNIDFGIKKNGYCSDLQRTWYFLRKGEKKAPDIVLEAFNLIRDTIALAAKKIRPGMEGWVVDDTVRSRIVAAGFPEYPHGLGHEIGRAAHDGTGLFPKWERYGTKPYDKVYENQVYTIEPRINIERYGVATLEEIIVVTKNGGKFLSTPQKELWYIK